MISKTVTCPTCGLTDQVDKVSTIYISSISRGRLNLDAQNRVEAEPGDSSVPIKAPPAELTELGRLLAPPASRQRRLSQDIHPDMVVIIFGAMFPFFLYSIWRSQPQFLVYAILTVAAFALFYMWQRKRMIARYTTRKIK